VNVERPFEVRRGSIGGRLPITIANAKRDGVSVIESPAGSQSAGSIQKLGAGGRPVPFQTHFKPEPKYVDVPRRYALLLNANLSAEARYATLVHELAHLYCGHLGTPNDTSGGPIDVGWITRLRSLRPNRFAISCVNVLGSKIRPINILPAISAPRNRSRRLVSIA
jgi:hypothetical protein